MKKLLLPAGLAMAVFAGSAAAPAPAAAQGYNSPQPHHWRKGPPPHHYGHERPHERKWRRDRERAYYYERRDRRHREVYRDYDRPRRPGFSIEIN